MSFKDIFKKSFLEGFTAMDISTSKILATLAMVVILSLYIFCIYRVVTRKTFYSKTFNISLAAIAMHHRQYHPGHAVQSWSSPLVWSVHFPSCVSVLPSRIPWA